MPLRKRASPRRHHVLGVLERPNRHPRPRHRRRISQTRRQGPRTVSATSSAPPQTVANVSAAPRIVSIDIFRGLTMAVMIFVNELDGTRGLPWWTFHAHADW